MGSISTTLAPTNKTAQSTNGFVQSVPPGAVSLRVLRTVEGELRRRKMIGGGSEAVTPIWFLAETERNIFLWRQGKSLDDADEFEFWVDISALLQKRRRQLENPQGLNPFTNPLWGSAPLDVRTLEAERNYLEDIEELSDCIIPHAEALSHASAIVQQELLPRATPPAKVVLPVSPGKRS